MDALNDFIQTTREGRELKRALAVKMRLGGYSRAEAAAVLGVSKSFVDKWRGKYAREGTACLSLKHQGSMGYLSPQDKADVLRWIQRQTTWNVRAVEQYVSETYGIRYKSLQSYYALLDAAHMSWKKSQDRQPKADPKKVAAKRKVIKKKRSWKRRPLS
jgi:putative transposase